MADELQPGSKEAMLRADELQDGQMDHELPTHTTVVGQLMGPEIERRPGHQVPRLQHTACQMASQPGRRLLDMAEAMRGAPKPQHISRNSSNLTTAGKVYQRRTAGVGTLTMHQHLAQTCLLLLLLL
jgi:hypothetical protein